MNKKKDANSISNEPDTPKPPTEGKTATMGFFYNIEGRKPALSHVGINSFGNWATIKIEDHPEVEITIKPEVEAYKELNWEIKMPKKTKEISRPALVDTGAQMVVMGMDDVHKMGLSKSSLIPVKLKIKAANSGG